MRGPLAAVLLHIALTLAARGADFTVVDNEIKRLMKDGSVPGAALVIVKDGEVVHTNAFGVTSVETNTAVTPRTLFRLGSTTKMFVALAILKLVDEGKLRLDQPVGEVVPGLARELHAITIEQLLTHTAGLTDQTPMNGPLEESAMHERVTSWQRDMLFAPPGEIFSYASTGYVLLGDVIAQVTKLPFSAAMQSLVLDPAGMRDSTFRPMDAFTRSVALGHDRTGVIRPMPEHAGNYPPGSLFTNAEDLGRFFAALTTKQLERLGAPRVAVPAQDRRYGYAMIADDRYRVPILLHTGGRSGYGSTFMFVPSQRVAVAVIANRTSATLSNAGFVALSQFVNLGDLKTLKDEVPLSATEIDALTGTYANGEALPAVVLAKEEQKLVVRFAGKTFPVKHVGRDHFAADGGGQLETFTIVRDTNGTPRYLCLEMWAFRKRS